MVTTAVPPDGVGLISTWYSRIGDPEFAGAVQLAVDRLVAPGCVGRGGRRRLWRPDAPAPEAGLGSESPTTLPATTVNVYSTSLVRPVMCTWWTGSRSPGRRATR